MRLLFGYLASAVTMLVLDLLWIGVVARPLYQQGLGHLMAAQPLLPAVVAFYALFLLGLALFALRPVGAEARWSAVLKRAALYGFFTYAAYDLTNLATLKGWPLPLSLIDIGWGVVLSVVSAAAGRAAMALLPAR